MISVSSLNTKIKSLLEATFMHIMVEGEVASCTYHASGHLYFSIKDDKSSIKCVMWRSNVAKMKFRIEKGMHIVVEGSVSVYTPRGEYQFQTLRIEPYGQGALALAYEQLKERLKAKGYFAKERKKPIPKMVRKIALVTAKDSAALHDMLKIIEQRWALVEVTVVDTLVQGEAAAPQIARALSYADTLQADVVVVGRGGGSAEDLWAFNEEIVADTIFAMQTPVVSAVGHEVDVVISDFVADLRAPTPSAAMEMVLPDRDELLYYLSEMSDRYHLAIQQKITHLQQKLTHIEELLVRSSPTRKLEEMTEKFEQLKHEFVRIGLYQIERKEHKLPQLKGEFTQSIQLFLGRKKQEADMLKEKFIIHHPKNQCRTGWAKISKDGKMVSLETLDTGMTFVLEDAFNKVEATCINKIKI